MDHLGILRVGPDLPVVRKAAVTLGECHEGRRPDNLELHRKPVQDTDLEELVGDFAIEVEACTQKSPVAGKIRSSRKNLTPNCAAVGRDVPERIAGSGNLHKGIEGDLPLSVKRETQSQKVIVRGPGPSQTLSKAYLPGRICDIVVSVVLELGSRAVIDDRTGDGVLGNRSGYRSCGYLHAGFGDPAGDELQLVYAHEATYAGREHTEPEFGMCGNSCKPSGERKRKDRGGENQKQGQDGDSFP